MAQGPPRGRGGADRKGKDMTDLKTARALQDHVGETFGPGEWVEITQEMIDDFANATGDRQWVHVDTERAARDMPGGKTIAHGFLTLSVIGTLMPPVFSVSCRQIINYGVEGLRFLNAVPVGSRLRLMVGIASVEETKPDQFKTVHNLVVELEGAERPALKADLIFIYFD